MSDTITALIFDMDDTLLKTSDVYAGALSDFVTLMQSEGFAQEKVLALFNELESSNMLVMGYSEERYARSMVETYDRLCAENALRSDPHIRAKAREIGTRVATTVPDLMPGCLDVLNSLRRDYRLLLITRGRNDWQSMKAGSRGLAGLFETIHVVQEKSADVIARVLAAERLSPRQVVFIGDSIRADIIPAIAVGAHAILVPYVCPNYVWHQDQVAPPSGPYLVASDLHQIPTMLVALTKEASQPQ